MHFVALGKPPGGACLSGSALPVFGTNKAQGVDNKWPARSCRLGWPRRDVLGCPRSSAGGMAILGEGNFPALHGCCRWFGFSKSFGNGRVTKMVRARSIYPDLRVARRRGLRGVALVLWRLFSACLRIWQRVIGHRGPTTAAGAERFSSSFAGFPKLRSSKLKTNALCFRHRGQTSFVESSRIYHRDAVECQQMNITDGPDMPL